MVVMRLTCFRRSFADKTSETHFREYSSPTDDDSYFVRIVPIVLGTDLVVSRYILRLSSCGNGL